MLLGGLESEMLYKETKSMRNKILLLTIIGLTLTIIGIGLKNVSSISRQENTEHRGTIAWRVRNAKITGEKEVKLSKFKSMQAIVADLDDALSQFKVIEAKPIEKYTEAGTWSLITWYKFKILDELNKGHSQECGSCDDLEHELAYIPKSLLPLESDEILICYTGGSLTIDGIKIIEPSEIPDFSIGATIENNDKPLSNKDESQTHKRLINSQRFLLFLSPSKSSKIGKLPLCSNGIFSISLENELKSMSSEPHIIKSQIKKFQTGSLERLKTHIQQMK
jgi:hypothetical protein